MIGIGFDVNDIIVDVLPEIEIINIENPLYSNYLNGDYSADIESFLGKAYGKTVITDGAYIDLNPGAAEKEIRETVKKKVGQSIDYAISVNSGEIIFLSTYLPMIQVGFYDESHINNSISFWKDMMSGTKNIRVSLCNTFEYDPDILIKIVEGVGRRDFGLAFDMGHALAYGRVALKDFYKRVEPYCNSIYIHSNNGSADEHINIFEGKLLNDGQFYEIAPMLRNKNVILKLFDKTHIRENLDTLRANGIA